MHPRSLSLRAYGLALLPAALATGCPSDDASVDTDTDSSSSTGDDPTSPTMTDSMTDTQPMMTTSDPDTSSTTLDPDSTGTETTDASSDTSSSETTSPPEESSSTGPNLCGNGVIDGGEDCDGDDLGGNACADVGFDTGTLACTSACTFDTFNCVIYICNNNVIDPTEFCDGTDLGGADCASEGFPLGGELACTLDCEEYDVSGCLTQLCGNENIEGNEDCDGSDLGGQSCASLGYGGGELACAATCQNFLTSGCANGNAQFAYVLNDTTPESITGYSVDSDGALVQLPGSPFATGGNSGFNHRPDALVSCGAYLYAANNLSGGISGFFVEADGTLTAVPGSPFAHPDAVSLACTEDYLFATDFAATVGRFSIEDDGSLTALGTVASSPSTLGLSVDDLAHRLVVAGLSDAVEMFDFDDAGNLAPVPSSPYVHDGSNHSAVFSPDGSFVATEGNSAVRIWSVANNGALTEVPGSPFADTADCEVVGLAWAPDSERLFVGHRVCSPGVISVYDVAGNGALTQVPGSPFLSGGDSTVGLAVDANGVRLFATHIASQTTSVLEIGNGGVLTPVAGSPFPNPVGGNHPTVVLRGGGAACQDPFGAPSYDPAITFPDAAALNQTRMTIAWDGTDYWASSGGSSDGNRLVQIDASGNVVSYYQPGFDVRSVFTKGDGVGPVFLRQYGDPQIYEQTSPGVFGTDVSLVNGMPLDDQSAVVWDDIHDYFIAHIDGTITRWDATGAYVDNIDLIGWGSEANENFSPQNRGIGWACGYFYTYSEEVLSAWDEQGNRVATTTLNGAGNSSDAYYSYGIANSMFFVVDFAGGTWRGYDAL